MLPARQRQMDGCGADKGWLRRLVGPVQEMGRHSCPVEHRHAQPHPLLTRLLPGCLPSCTAQVVELQLGMDSEVVWREARLLQRCTHERIVPFFGVAIQGQLLMLAMQHMERGSLAAALGSPEARQQLRWDAR